MGRFEEDRYVAEYTTAMPVDAVPERLSLESDGEPAWIVA
jgi:hypothetical protein